MRKKTTKKKVKDKEIIKTVKQLSKENYKYRRNKILAIILHEGKGSSWFWIEDKTEQFEHNENTYFVVDDGTHVKGTIRFMIYLEGISLPLHHGYFEKEEVVKTIFNKITKKKETHKFWRIKGLKIDSKIINILLNRHLADEFTKTHMDLPNLVIIILLVITVFTGVLNTIITYFGFGSG